ncbi:glycosyl hydrolase family 8 [Fulvimarina sp. MAC8]
MKGWFCAALAVLMLLVGTTFGAAPARSATIQPDDWSAYKAAFVNQDGRVIDTGNGGISHSEGQGYGLLLAYLANDPAAFDLIWSFTRTEFLLRDDGLAVWRWDPNKTPHVTDPNNATDGDILIAYALASAGRDWNREELTTTATGMAKAIGHLVQLHQGRTIMLAGKAGYGADDRKDGPVVNLSYWVYEAFPVLAELAPDTEWSSLNQSGLTLLEQAQFGPRNLPPEWLSLRTRPKPADGFENRFGYNALRIPLYLARAGVRDRALLTRLREGMTNDDGQVVVVDLDSGTVEEVLSEPGYAILPALVSCVIDQRPIDPKIRRFEPTLYYPSTIHLLALSYLSEEHLDCLR